MNVPTIRYTLLTRLLHWIIAVLIIGMIALGWYMMSIAKQPNSGAYFWWHKSFGILTALLIIIRSILYLRREPLPYSLYVPEWQINASRLMHAALYVAILIMPITGFMGSMFSTHPISFFGLNIPKIVVPNKSITDFLFVIHGYLAWILLGLIVLHILAALKHLLINRDNVFQRVWF